MLLSSLILVTCNFPRGLRPFFTILFYLLLCSMICSPRSKSSYVRLRKVLTLPLAVLWIIPESWQICQIIRDSPNQNHSNYWNTFGWSIHIFFCLMRVIPPSCVVYVANFCVIFLTIIFSVWPKCFFPPANERSNTLALYELLKLHTFNFAAGWDKRSDEMAVL